MFKFLSSAFVPRFLRFRKEAMILWRAFRAPETPGYLKVATGLVVLYLVSPFDILPEFIPFVGFIDDLILVPMAMSWIVSRLPVKVEAETRERNDVRRPTTGQTIDGSARRL